LSIDVDPVDADRSVPIAHEVIGDLDASLEWLAQRPALRPEWPATMTAQHRDRFHRSLRPTSAGFAPHHAIDVVREVLPRDGILAFDVGAHTHQIASQWTAHAPRTTAGHQWGSGCRQPSRRSSPARSARWWP